MNFLKIDKAMLVILSYILKYLIKIYIKFIERHHIKLCMFVFVSVGFRSYLLQL